MYFIGYQFLVELERFHSWKVNVPNSNREFQAGGHLIQPLIKLYSLFIRLKAKDFPAMTAISTTPPRFTFAQSHRFIQTLNPYLAC
jgi:hypothetical protein